jgi:cell division septation protein DedD
VGTATVIIESRGTVAVSSSGAEVLPPVTAAPNPGNTIPSVEPVRPTAVPAARGPAAEIRPGIPPAGSNKRYRIQVGAYKVLQNARDVFDKLKNTGLNPAYERIEAANGDIYRVVLAGIKSDDVRLIAEKLGSAGFREALIREE